MSALDAWEKARDERASIALVIAEDVAAGYPVSDHMIGRFLAAEAAVHKARIALGWAAVSR